MATPMERQVGRASELPRPSPRLTSWPETTILAMTPPASNCRSGTETLTGSGLRGRKRYLTRTYTGAGDGNRTRTVSLGIGIIRAVTSPDLRSR